MTLSDLRTHTNELLAADLFAYKGPTVGNSDMNVVINRALEMAGRRLYLYSQSVTMTITDNVRVFNLDSAFARKMLSVDMVRVTTASGTTLLRDHTQRYGVWTLAQLEAKHPDYLTLTKGTPDKVAVTAESLVFYRPLDSATVTGVTVRGRHLPLALSGDSDVPEINDDLHRYIAYLAAIILAEPVATTEEAWNRIQSYAATSGQEFQAEYERQFRAVHGRSPAVA